MKCFPPFEISLDQTCWPLQKNKKQKNYVNLPFHMFSHVEIVLNLNGKHKKNMCFAY